MTSQKMISMTFPAEACVLNFYWPKTTGASTSSIVSYSLVHNDKPRTRLLSQFDGEKYLLYEHDGLNAVDKLSAMHACDLTAALEPICYTISCIRGHHGQYCIQSTDLCSILQQFHQ
jgi:hypothetical protein